MGGCFVAQSFRTDVGHTVSTGVGQARTGIPGEIDAKAVRRTQTRALTDEYDGERRAEAIRHLVADGDPRLLYDHERSDLPNHGLEFVENACEQRRSVALDRDSREPVGDDENHVEPPMLFSDQPMRVGAQTTAQV